MVRATSSCTCTHLQGCREMHDLTSWMIAVLPQVTAGLVSEVGLFATEIHRVDGVYVFVPNSDLWNKPVSNLSRLPTRMIELRVTIKKATNIQSARERLLSAAASEESVQETPPPAVQV